MLTEGPKAGEHAFLIVDMDTPGIRHLRTPAYSHTYAHHHWEMGFEDVRYRPHKWSEPKATG